MDVRFVTVRFVVVFVNVKIPAVIVKLLETVRVNA
jgi:hypothetical protein